MKQTLLISLLLFVLFACQNDDKFKIITELDQSKIENKLIVKAFNDFISKYKNKDEVNLSHFHCFKVKDSPRKDLNPYIIYFIYDINFNTCISKYYVENDLLVSLGHEITCQNSRDFDDLDFLLYKEIPENKKDELLNDTEYYANQYYLIEKDFYNWARFMPSVLMCDTIDSKQELVPTQYNKKYLSQDTEILGRFFVFENSPKESLNYIIYLYMENSKITPYLEIYNYYNKRLFRRKLFDTEFIEKNSSNSSRFYMIDRYLIFENVVNFDDKITVVKRDSIDFMKQNRFLKNVK
jgi:hypothetical protein